MILFCRKAIIRATATHTFRHVASGEESRCADYGHAAPLERTKQNDGRFMDRAMARLASKLDTAFIDFSLLLCLGAALSRGQRSADASRPIFFVASYFMAATISLARTSPSFRFSAVSADDRMLAGNMSFTAAADFVYTPTCVTPSRAAGHDISRRRASHNIYRRNAIYARLSAPRPKEGHYGWAFAAIVTCRA